MIGASSNGCWPWPSLLRMRCAVWQCMSGDVLREPSYWQWDGTHKHTHANAAGLCVWSLGCQPAKPVLLVCLAHRVTLGSCSATRAAHLCSAVDDTQAVAVVQVWIMHARCLCCCVVAAVAEFCTIVNAARCSCMCISSC